MCTAGVGKHLRLNACCEGVHQQALLPADLRGSVVHRRTVAGEALPMQRVSRHMLDQRPQGTASCSSNCRQGSRRVLACSRQDSNTPWLLPLQVVWQHEGVRVCCAGLPFL